MGLKTVTSLLTLDVSDNHLTSFSGVENCGLIRCIKAKNNSISILDSKELSNAVSVWYVFMYLARVYCCTTAGDLL